MNETYSLGSILYGIGIWFTLIYGCYWILSRHHDFKGNWLAVIAILFPMNTLVASVFVLAAALRILYERFWRKGVTNGYPVVH